MNPVRRYLDERGPGLVLCAVVATAAYAAERLQVLMIGRGYLDPLVLAILFGIAVRSTWTPGPRFIKGIALAGKVLLEIAVMLLGASLSLQLILAVGPALVLAILAVVVVALAASYAVGRLLGLSRRMAVLIACGNSICGNSAIVAVAPVIGASAGEVAASVTFTAVLGVVVVLGLPFLVPLAGLTEPQYGVVAGLTVYAVPQVLAATAPVGPLSLQVGTFVKLVRVLMLGPVVLGLSLLSARRGAPSRPPWARLVPGFILGFLALMAARSLGLIPVALLDPIWLVTKVLTILAMAALGLGVDVATVARAGGRVTLAVTLSILLLAAVSVLVAWSGLVR